VDGFDLDDCAGEFDAAFKVALDRPKLFERALSRASLWRGYGGKQWAAYEFGGEKTARSHHEDEDARTRLIDAIRAISKTPDNRKYEADWFSVRRRDPDTGAERSVLHLTLYLEERPQIGMEFRNDVLAPHLTPRVAELGFVYDPTDGVVEVCAKGNKLDRNKYAAAFGECLFGKACEPNEIIRRDIDFDTFLKRPAFETYTAERVVSCEVIELRFGRDGFFAQYECKDKNTDADIYARLAEMGDRSPLIRSEGWYLVAATLRIVRAFGDGKRDQKTLIVDLKSSNRTSLRNKTEDDRVFVHTLLERWGAFVDTTPLVEVA